MLTMLAWMSAILACLLLVVALLPLTFEWQIIGTRVRSRLLWGFGVVSLELRRPRGARRARSDVRSRRGGKAQPPRPGLVMQILAEPSFRGALVKVLRRLLRACHPHAVTVEAVIDLGDPGATGMLWSALGPWAGALRSRPWGSVDLRPGFQDEGMALRGRGRFTVVPVEVLVIVVAFVLSPAVMRAGWTLAGGGRS